MRSKTRSRQGITLIVLMLFLAVASSLILSWLKLAGIERRQERTIRAAAQAEWLAESAIGRAAARLKTDPTYTGETWVVPATDLGGRDDGQVSIRVEPVEASATQRLITLQADYPTDPVRRQRRTKSIPISIEPTIKGDN